MGGTRAKGDKLCTECTVACLFHILMANTKYDGNPLTRQTYFKEIESDCAST